MLFSKTFLTHNKNAFCYLTAILQFSNIFLFLLQNSIWWFLRVIAFIVLSIFCCFFSAFFMDRTFISFTFFLSSTMMSSLFWIDLSCSSQSIISCRMNFLLSFYFSWDMKVLKAFLTYVSWFLRMWSIILFIIFDFCFSLFAQSFQNLNLEAVVSV